MYYKSIITGITYTVGLDTKVTEDYIFNLYAVGTSMGVYRVIKKCMIEISEEEAITIALDQPTLGQIITDSEQADYYN